MVKTPAKGPGKGHERLTEKQDAFALAFLETGNAAEAYRRAYDVSENAKSEWIYVEACQLLDNPKVALRLEQLQEQARKLAIFTVGNAIDEYEAARLMAMDEKNPSAAVSAVTGKVRLFGLDRPQRVEHTGKDGGPIQTEDVNSDASNFARRMASLAARADADGTGEADGGSEG